MSDVHIYRATVRAYLAQYRYPRRRTFTTQAEYATKADALVQVGTIIGWGEVIEARVLAVCDPYGEPFVVWSARMKVSG